MPTGLVPSSRFSLHERDALREDSVAVTQAGDLGCFGGRGGVGDKRVEFGRGVAEEGLRGFGGGGEVAGAWLHWGGTFLF